MIKNYLLSNGTVSETETDRANILHYIKPTEAEKLELIARYQLDPHDLESALTPHALPRIEFENNHFVCIFKKPKNYTARDKLQFKTAAIGIFLFENQMLIVSSGEIAFASDKKSNQKIQSLQDYLIYLLGIASNHFLEHLKVINMISDELEEKINQSTDNKYLMNLFTLSKSLVYYINSLDANSVLLEKIRKSALRLKLTEDQIDLLDDLLIDNQQCYRQATIYSTIVNGLLDARASIISNNLNVLMKNLNAIMIAIMVPSLLAGIGGMSEWSAATGGIDNWRVSYSFFLALSLLIAGVVFWIIKKLERH